MRKQRTLLTLEQRLLKRRYIDPVTDCWMWTGRKTKTGYGVMDGLQRQQLPVRATTVSRLAAHAWLGFDLRRRELDVCHRCDTPSCFNPAHLFIGSRKENMLDCVMKGRMDRKLTREASEAIRLEYKTGLTQVQLAAKYCVSQQNISSVIIGAIRTFAP